MSDQKPPEPSLFRRYTEALAYLTIAAMIGGFFARWWWPLEALCHPRLQFGCVLLLLCPLITWSGGKKLAIAAGVLGVVPFLWVVPLYFGADPAGESHLRIEAINVLTSNRDYDEVLSIVEQDDPDVLILIETDDRWIRGVASLKEKWPHYQVASREDNFGIAIFSRIPLTDCRFVPLVDQRIQAIIAHAQIDGRDVRIIGAHPMPPITRKCAALRNRQLEELKRWAAEHSGPTVLAGDLNLTSYSPYFGDLLREGKLKDTRQGRGLLHSHSSFASTLRMAIDHILVSDDVLVRKRWVTSCKGSDHDAVAADLAISAP